MRKKIIYVIGIMLLSITMFGCAGGKLKIPRNLDLKEVYKSQVSETYADNFIKCTSYAIELYKNIDNVKSEDLPKFNSLEKTLLKSKSGSTLTESEMVLSKKIDTVCNDIVYYSLGNNTKEDKVKMKIDMQILLDLYN